MSLGRFSSVCCLVAMILAPGCDTPTSTAKSSGKGESKGSESASKTKSPSGGSSPTESPPREFATIDKAVEELTKAGDAGDSAKMVRIAEWIAEHHPQAGLEPLGAVLTDKDASVGSRVAATRALYRLGPPAAPHLEHAVNSSDSHVRVNGIKTLAQIRPLPPNFVPRLVAWIDDDDLQVRRAAVQSLRRIGPPAAASADRLNAILNDPDENETLRTEAKQALKSVDPRRTLLD